MKKIGKYTIWIGLLLIVLGFMYDIMFAGIPHQDPPMDLEMTYNRDLNIASWIMKSGLIVAVSGVLVRITYSVRQFLRKKT